jgi:hypothetical protein
MWARFKARAGEPSTWAGLAALAAILGVEGAETWTGPEVAGAIAALAAILMKEKSK